MFLHLYEIGYSRFRRLKEHYQEHGIFPRIHGTPNECQGMQCPKNLLRQQEQAANLSYEAKSEYVKAHQEHLSTAQTEREYYRNSCNDCKSFLQTLDTDTLLNCETRGPRSLNVTIHYSFDFARQIHFPSNPMRPGPIYFKTPRKCGIFGVMCEGIPR